MGRFRNLSESFKAAAFHGHGSSASSPIANNSRSDLPDDAISPVRESQLPGKEPAIYSSQASTPTEPRVGRSSRPVSAVYATPTNTDMAREGQIEELVPVFTFLSSHSNKLYQEGYFLKLNDLDIHGKPTAERNWTECFAQLVGTVLSLWDAAALDTAGQDGEVPPTFINLADASIKMIETLPTRNPDVQPLQNVLSISTAGKNRYLLHFNSLHSLTQWTAGIRLAMFEHASLQELYTGSLIAGKGKNLNNIRTIMERTRFRTEDWARVRFGAGTPWRRCWCVIEPPDSKEFEKSQKAVKKRSAYDRPLQPKGEIKFYDTKKTKKVKPIATITDAYSAYAIYPQSKPLIDQSTLVKVEGKITIHSNPESKTEGFVFVMPELHAAVSGFEMMLRWLFPVYDTFGLYGRPSRLIADTLDTRGLMFAMPRERRYGYLDIIDVAAMIHTDGSDKWSEREWRKQMKEFSSKRMQLKGQVRASGELSRRGTRNTSQTRNGMRPDDAASIRSNPSLRHHQNQSTDAVFIGPRKTNTAPMPGTLSLNDVRHNRSVSESVTPNKIRRQKDPYLQSRLSMDNESPERIDATPVPPPHRQKNGVELAMSNSRTSSDGELTTRAEEIRQDMQQQMPPAPVATPPVFKRQASDRPIVRPDSRNSLRYEQNRMSSATLAQMVDASRSGGAVNPGQAAMAAWKTGRPNEERNQGVGAHPVALGMPANDTSKEVVEQKRSTSQHSVARKPLPHSASQLSVDRKNNALPPLPTRQPDRASVYTVSNYEQDADSDESPDYASTRKSEETTHSIPRPRAGVLKTIGDPNRNHGVPPLPTKVDIPAVNFGITRSLTPDPVGVLTPSGRSPTESPITPGKRTPSRTTEGLTPKEEFKYQYGKTSPQASRPNSYIWQPGAAIRQNPEGTVTPEEFVQQRAAAARVPSGYFPQRTTSPAQLPGAAPQPKRLQKRGTGSRPGSRNDVLADFAPSLSAREQEHIARMTGGTLVNMPYSSRTPDPNVGLVGAIEAREQDRRNMHQGISSQLAQTNIAQHQHQSQAQAQAQMQMQMQMQQYQGYGPGPIYYEQQQAQQYPPQQNFYGVPSQQGYYQNQQQQRYNGHYPPQEGYGRRG